MNPGEGKVKIESLGYFIDETILNEADTTIILLPENWPIHAEEPIYSSTSESILKLFSQKRIPCISFTSITPSTHIRDNRYLDWVAPMLLVSAALLTENPLALNIALNVIANYVTDVFRGIKKDPVINLTIIYSGRKNAGNNKIKYEGPVSGLQEISNIISKLNIKD